ncbi:MAG: transcription antitermination factor NusB [Terriglobales bacterium]
MATSPARVAAFDILLRIEQQHAYASELLHSSQYAKLSPADHGLATELVMGVLRWRSLLDEEIGRFSDQRVAKLDIEVLTALRLTAYQLLFLDRIPGRAAVHESVELVKRARKGSAVPFANAVLRKLAGSISAARSPQPAVAASQELEHFSIREFAVEQRNETGLETAAASARKLAHPLWLVERWERRFGLDKVRRICTYDQQAPPTAVRLTDASTEAELARDGIDLVPGELLACARKVRSGNVSRTRAFAEGRVSIQDEASQLVALLVGTGSKILDCCAAPGGKTRVLAERNPDANIVALELHAHRALLLRKLVLAGHVEVINSDILEFKKSANFDRVLADVPCSGTGTLAHNPEIKWKLQPADLADLHRRQIAILRAAMQQVAPGGRLVYSTCSLEPEENERVVDEALSSSDPAFRVVDCRLELERLRAQGELVWNDVDSLVSGRSVRTIPGVHPCDGFFVAILEKS